MKRFTPLSLQHFSSSSYVAFSMTRCRSEPASGSVRSIDIVSPAQMRGIYLSRCSSLPNSYSVSMHDCRLQMFWKPASAADIISLSIEKVMFGTFSPPYLRGIDTPHSPAFRVASMFSSVFEAYTMRLFSRRGPSMSTSSLFGSIMFAAMSPVMSRICV